MRKREECDVKKSIAFLVPSLGDMGGSVRVATQLANALCERYETMIISCAKFDQAAFYLKESIETFSLDVQGKRVREKVQEAKEPLTALLVHKKPDILFGIGTYETLMAIRPARSTKTKLVFCDHGALINQWDDKQMRAIRLLDALFSSKTVTLTHRSLEDYRSRLHVSRKKLICIPNWVSHELLDARRPYHVAAKKLLWAGRLDREKGVDHLVEIAARVLPRHPDWTWDVFGEVVAGNEFDIAEEIARRGIADQVRLMGKVDNLYQLYSEYAVVTLTSYREGLPLVLLEGKACALPLISFDVNTGPSDIIEDGVDGFLVPCYDRDVYAKKLDALMSDESLRVRMSQASQKGIARFCEDAIYVQWENLIEGLVS